MYALVDLTQKKDGKLSSTSEKCKWSVFSDPRKRKLSPKKASDVKFKKYNILESQPVKSVSQSENMLKAGKSSFNEENFKKKLEICNPRAGWLLNFVQNCAEIKLPTLIDIDFHYHDSVDLTSAIVNNLFVRTLERMKFNYEECQKLEKATRGQASNTYWWDERQTRLTASNFGDIMHMKPETLNNPEKSVNRIMYSKVNNKFVDWGKKHEAAARMKYRIVMKKNFPDIKVEQCGLLVLPELPYLGASPDGLVTYTRDGETVKGILEIKCPASDKWKVLQPEKCCEDPDFFCTYNSDLNKAVLKRNHKYYSQIQGQLAISGLHWCDFVVWTLGGISVERIHRDRDYWESMHPKLTQYYLKVIIPELYTRRVKRGLKLFK